MSQAVAQAGSAVERRTHYRWVVLVLIFLIYTIASADRANIGIAIPFIKAEFGLSNTEVGAIVSLFSLTYGIFQIPSAFLVQRLGVRTVMPLFMILTSILTATLGTATSALALQINRLALGVAEAPLANSLITTINNWFAPQEKGQAAGIFISAAKFGPVLVPPLGAVVILHFGWQYVFYFCAVPGIILPILWFLLVPDSPAESHLVSKIEAEHIAAAPVVLAGGRPADAGPRRSLGWLDRLIRARTVVPIATTRGLLRSWTIWGVGLGYFLFQGIVGVILAWLPLYLTTVKKFSILNVGLVAAAPFAGAVTGNIIGGWLSDRAFAKRRKPTMMISAVATVVMMYSLVYAPNEPAVLGLLMFATGLLLSIGYSAFGIFPSGMTTKAIFPVGTAIINTCGQLGGAAIPFAVGIVLDRAGWDTVFMLLSVSSFVTLLLLATIVEPIAPEKQEA